MSVLIINANTSAPIAITVQQAGQSQPTEIGSVTQSFNGADRSSVRGVKRNFTALSSILDTTSKDAIISLLKYGAQLPCSGDLFGNIQTQCTVRYTGCRMIPGLGGSYWEVGLSLQEVQGSTVLLKYAPGDTITGESFTRSTTARYSSSAGVVTAAAINTKRDLHYDAAVRSILLEDARINICLQSENFGTTWVAVGTPTRSAGAHTASGISLDLIGDDSAVAVEGYQQTITFTGNAVKAISIHVRQGTATNSVIRLADSTAGTTLLLGELTWSAGVPVLAMSFGTFLWKEALTDGVYRLWFTTLSVTAANVNTVAVFPASTAASDVTKTGNLYAGGVQVENAPFPSSYNSTTTGSVARTIDLYSIPFVYPPSEMTIYAKFVERGTISTPTGRIFTISNAADTGAELLILPSGGFYQAYHSNGASAVTSTLAVAPTFGDTVELNMRFHADSTVQLSQTINGGAEVTANQSVPNGFASAWSAPLVWLNSAGSNAAGFVGLQSFKIVAGARSLSEMRGA